MRGPQRPQAPCVFLPARLYAREAAEDVSRQPGYPPPTGKTSIRHSRVDQHQRDASLPAGEKLVGPQFALDETGGVGPPVRQKAVDPGRDIQWREPMQHVPTQPKLRQLSVEQFLRSHGAGRQQHLGPRPQRAQHRQDRGRLSYARGVDPQQRTGRPFGPIDTPSLRQPFCYFSAAGHPPAQIYPQRRGQERGRHSPAGA